MKCPAEKILCPLLDKSSNGILWCNTNTDVYGFERCPWPKKRIKWIKKLNREKNKGNT